ncbi:MAG TPA: hypothetical protein PLZ78_08925 [Spirochaetota bacterium]|nr:hypothetical protein [Spirochaetota bacterium]
MKQYQIMSPTLGLNDQIPGIFLNEAYSQNMDIIFQYGEVWRAKKRAVEFSYVFEDAIQSIEYYYKDTTSEWWSIYFTARDIAYRDVNNDRFVFINKVVTTGTIVGATPASGTTFILEFSGVNIVSAGVAADDFICITNGTPPYTTDDTWYEVEEVIDATHLRCNGALPSGYVIGSLGNDYVIRLTFNHGASKQWSITTHEEVLIATNEGIDNIIEWSGTGQVTDMSCPYKAERVYAYNGYLLLIRTIETGTLYPFRIRWSGLRDRTAWTGSPTDDSGYMECDEGSGTVTDCSKVKGYLIIVKSNALIKGWLTGDDNIFEKKLVIDGNGSPAARSIMEMDNEIYFWDSMNTFSRFDGINVYNVGKNIDQVCKNLNPNYVHLIETTYIEEYNQILWAIPYSTSETLNRIMALDLDMENPTWTMLDMEVTCLGYYESEETLDWASLPYSNWNDWDWPDWKHRAGLSAFPIDLCGQSDGSVGRLNFANTDYGADYEAYIVLTTDLGRKRALPLKKRLLKAQFYFKRQAAGTIDISVRRDNEQNYTLAGTLDMTGSEDIIIRELPVDNTLAKDFDYLAKTFEIKVHGEYYFAFLGVVFFFDEVGDR